MPTYLLVMLIVLAVAGGLYVGYKAGDKPPRLGSEESQRKSIGARARDTATRGVLSLWRWNRARKKKARNDARDRDRGRDLDRE